MRDALSRTALLGVLTNLARLQAVLSHPAFVRGELHTAFIEEHLEPPGARGGPPPEAIAAAMAAVHHSSSIRPRSRDAGPAVHDPWVEVGPWRLA